MPWQRNESHANKDQPQFNANQDLQHVHIHVRDNGCR